MIADAIARATDGCDALYLSVDIDVLDPGFAPGTGTPEPGGMNPADLLRAVRSIVLSAPVVALDVVEVSPPYDHADNTVNAAHRVVLETLGALAHKKRERAGGEVTRPGTRPDAASPALPGRTDGLVPPRRLRSHLHRRRLARRPPRALTVLRPRPIAGPRSYVRLRNRGRICP